MRHALANALKDFGARPLPRTETFDFALPASEPETAFAMPELGSDQAPFAVQPVDHTAAAVAEAETALAQRLGEEHEQALVAERERHAEEIAALNTLHAEETAPRIAQSLAEMEARLTELTGAVAARILGALVSDDMRDRSIALLSQTIHEAVRDSDGVRIRVRGNPALFEALKASLGERADQIDFAEAAGFDISVTVDDSVFETRLAEWSTALSEVLA